MIELVKQEQEGIEMTEYKFGVFPSDELARASLAANKLAAIKPDKSREEEIKLAKRRLRLEEAALNAGEKTAVALQHGEKMAIIYEMEWWEDPQDQDVVDFIATLAKMVGAYAEVNVETTDMIPTNGFPSCTYGIVVRFRT